MRPRSATRLLHALKAAGPQSAAVIARRLGVTSTAVAPTSGEAAGRGSRRLRGSGGGCRPPTPALAPHREGTWPLSRQPCRPRAGSDPDRGPRLRRRRARRADLGPRAGELRALQRTARQRRSPPAAPPSCGAAQRGRLYGRGRRRRRTAAFSSARITARSASPPALARASAAPSSPSSAPSSARSVEVERIEHILAGARRCAYRIRMV